LKPYKQAVNYEFKHMSDDDSYACCSLKQELNLFLVP